MGFWSRLLGTCRTRPADASAWSYGENQVLLDAARIPELASPGGAVRLEGAGLPLRVLAFRDDNGVARAMHNKCTHAGRRLDPLPGPRGGGMLQRGPIAVQLRGRQDRRPGQGGGRDISGAGRRRKMGHHPAFEPVLIGAPGGCPAARRGRP